MSSKDPAPGSLLDFVQKADPKIYAIYNDIRLLLEKWQNTGLTQIAAEKEHMMILVKAYTDNDQLFYISEYQVAKFLAGIKSNSITDNDECERLLSYLRPTMMHLNHVRTKELEAYGWCNRSNKNRASLKAKEGQIVYVLVEEPLRDGRISAASIMRNSTVAGDRILEA
ncbi:hypothetical protein CLAFUW4_04039 [Fulvia fulva]|uniref:Uncharacterized protein n=1 Tax=Passalora fulva TaxID=5499 RepID=A0A9Q8LFM5_PASFU|nr:uncharacterized protein CLAFUR5_04003 [Fulvia fulva]KAK4626911.1 hypothetical protein CLAFUR4_04025 [Fulvia fulva]KAK4628551.1 hypothetical protein CLAFUR0_04026 [Fulvia fulva]UJO16701.1 hypothetical protein CLAFUR5_04003 [Fulvia fulva]WPV14277.1 hypothetical protein CLAFUW4_04039 [Fulvia fulva]WPV28651.1 hypothetical protein CLAFUW7_04028 [Fulvia fulva]